MPDIRGEISNYSRKTEEILLHLLKDIDDLKSQLSNEIIEREQQVRNKIRRRQIFSKSLELFFHTLWRILFNLRPTWPTDVCVAKTYTNIQIRLPKGMKK